MPTMTAKRLEFLSNAPVTYLTALQRAYAGTVSPRQAIKAKCLECTGFVRADIRHCTSELCPLHAYRPYQT